jgi:hypothetical protein
MAETLPRVIKGNALSLSLLIIGLILLTEPIFDFSRVFPDGVFHLTFGILLLVCGVLLYWSGRDPDDQELHG